MGSVIPLFVFMPAAISLNPRTWLATGVCAVIGALGGVQLAAPAADFLEQSPEL